VLKPNFPGECLFDHLLALFSSSHTRLHFHSIHPDILFSTENGYIPDIGAVIPLLKAATCKEPKVIGKPNKGMVEVDISKLALPRDQIAIVGDRIYTDIILHRSSVQD